MKLFLTTTSALIASLAVLQLASELPSASAKPSFVARIPNGANVPDVLAVGHADPEGSNEDLNVFGDDFKKAGKKWTVALCQMDSDGDGQTNGQELGDPCCTWTTDAPAVRWSDGVSDPGVKTKTSSATLLASVSCSGGGSSSAAAPSPATPASTPAASKATANSTTNSTSSSSVPSPASATPSSSTAKTPTASTTNSTATKSATTTAPTTAPATSTSAAPDHSLGFSALTLLSAITLGAIAAIRD